MRTHVFFCLAGFLAVLAASSCVADGRFAHKGCGTFEFHPADRPAKSWAVNGKEAKDKGVLTFEWTAPVTASQIIYYPRMAWLSR